MIAGKYRLERELASGGMGAVWAARHLQLDEPVAIKFMSATLPELADARARFAREAKAAARLRSAHVVQVLDHGVDGDVPYIVMELLEGEHLGERLKRERRLTLRAAASIAAQVGKALARAHRAGVVHRDLKPANIFLARVDDEEIVKVLDFGIAKTLGRTDEVTHSDVLMGSPQYMSPEQARGTRRIDHRADLWSFGAILFRAVTGVQAFDGGTAVDVIVQICTADVPIATSVAPGLPPALDAFFVRALAREPQRRFASALEMSEAFIAVVNGVSPPVASQPRAAESGERSRIDEDVQTYVMDRRAAEIDAFVERAFQTLLEPATEAFDAAPPTAPRRTSRPPPASAARTDSTVPNGIAALRKIEAESSSESIAARSADAHDAHDAHHAVDANAARTEVADAGSSPPPRLTYRRAIRRGTSTSGTSTSGTSTNGASTNGASNGEAAGAITTLIEQGFAALRLGEPDSARRAWREALGMDPSNRMLELNLRRLDAMVALPRGRGE